MGVDGGQTGRPQVGDAATRSRLVTARDIELFTEISGDRNPLHYDAELAARSRFGGIVVQGGVTTAVLNAVVAEDLPGPGSVFLQLDLRFLAPVRPGGRHHRRGGGDLRPGRQADHGPGRAGRPGTTASWPSAGPRSAGRRRSIDRAREVTIKHSTSGHVGDERQRGGVVTAAVVLERDAELDRLDARCGGPRGDTVRWW